MTGMERGLLGPKRWNKLWVLREAAKKMALNINVASLKGTIQPNKSVPKMCSTKNTTNAFGEWRVSLRKLMKSEMRIVNLNLIPQLNQTVLMRMTTGVRNSLSKRASQDSRHRSRQNR